MPPDNGERRLAALRLRLPAILEAWYPGQSGGTAAAETLFGDFNPAGRLPVTFYQSTDQLPPFEDYRMDGRTYRYFQGEPLYPFGYGLSFTSFEYAGLEISPDPARVGEDVSISLEVKNTGQLGGDEVAQLYLKRISPSFGSAALDQEYPLQLQAFQRFYLEAGESRKLTFALTSEQLSFVNESGERLIEPGEYRIAVGGQFPGQRIEKDAPRGEFVSNILVKEFKLRTCMSA